EPAARIKPGDVPVEADVPYRGPIGPRARQALRDPRADWRAGAGQRARQHQTKRRTGGGPAGTRRAGRRGPSRAIALPLVLSCRILGKYFAGAQFISPLCFAMKPRSP